MILLLLAPRQRLIWFTCPYARTIIPHIQRVNHRVACYKREAESIFGKPKPDSESQGWLRTDGVVEPVHWPYIATILSCSVTVSLNMIMTRMMLSRI